MLNELNLLLDILSEKKQKIRRLFYNKEIFHA